MKHINIILTYLLLNVSVVFAQKNPNDSTLRDVGVAVTPSHINFNLKPGETRTVEVKVTNETRSSKTFNVRFSDYDADNAGKSEFLAPGTSKFGISNWISAAPTFFEVKPGEVKKIAVTLTVPDTDSTNHAAWGLLWIEEKKEREAIDNAGNDKAISLGVIPTFAFGVYIYQNPPSVKNNKVEFQNFTFQNLNNQPKIDMVLRNAGDGIASCIAYVELTNLSTGKQQKLSVKRFTILPGYIRNYMFALPEKLEKGKYSAVGILDYGNKEAVEAAELSFTIE